MIIPSRTIDDERLVRYYISRNCKTSALFQKHNRQSRRTHRSYSPSLDFNIIHSHYAEKMKQITFARELACHDQYPIEQSPRTRQTHHLLRCNYPISVHVCDAQFKQLRQPTGSIDSHGCVSVMRKNDSRWSGRISCDGRVPRLVWVRRGCSHIDAGTAIFVCEICFVDNQYDET